MKNKKIMIAFIALIVIITAFILALKSCNNGRDDTHIDETKVEIAITATTAQETTAAGSTEPVVTTTEEVVTTAVETTEPTELTTEATEPATEETQPKPTEPKPTESKPAEPKPTEPKPTEPKPQPTEPKPTEPAPQPTEPKPTEPEPTEPEPTNPPASYNTAWGTRPFEFQEIIHKSFWVYTWHMDRYGNSWWDTTDGYSSASGKYIYKCAMLAYNTTDVRYYGNGRWSGKGYYWDSNGLMVGSYGAYYPGCPSDWGDYEVYSLPGDMPYDVFTDYLNVYANYTDHQAMGIPSELPDGTIVTQEMYDEVANGGFVFSYSPYTGR